MRVVGSLLVLAAAASCVPAARPGMRSRLEGSCFARIEVIRAFDVRGSAADTTVFRLTRGRARGDEIGGDTRAWNVVDPGFGLRFTLWRPLGHDSVRIAYSNSEMDVGSMRLAVTDSGLVGSDQFDSDLIRDVDPGEPPPPPVFLPRMACPPRDGHAVPRRD